MRQTVCRCFNLPALRARAFVRVCVRVHAARHDDEITTRRAFRRVSPRERRREFAPSGASPLDSRSPRPRSSGASSLSSRPVLLPALPVEVSLSPFSPSRLPPSSSRILFPFGVLPALDSSSRGCRLSLFLFFPSSPKLVSVVSLCLTSSRSTVRPDCRGEISGCFRRDCTRRNASVRVSSSPPLFFIARHVDTRKIPPRIPFAETASIKKKTASLTTDRKIEHAHRSYGDDSESLR